MSIQYLLHSIPKRSSVCSVCQKPLSEQDAISTLRELAKSSLDRKDVCCVCQTQAQTHSTDEEIFFWKPVSKTMPKEKKKKISSDAKALELLRESVSLQDPTNKKEVFILTLHLLRRRKLRFIKKVEEALDEPKGVFEVISTGEELILDLAADLSDIDVEFQKRLFTRLTQD